VEAANHAISSPLLEDASVNGARGVIINVTGGSDLSLLEVSEASSIIQKAAHEDANIIFGAVVDPRMEGQVKLTVIATGFDLPGTVAASPGATPTHTPVDLGQYASWRQDAAVERVGGIRLGLSRRPALELPLHALSSGKPSDGADLVAEAEADSALEVPAFLRRPSGL